MTGPAKTATKTATDAEAETKAETMAETEADSGPGAAPKPTRGRPVFLEKASYRRRRIVDAVRLLPVIGGLLWAVPLLWTPGTTRASAALLYVFAIWVILVIAAALFARGVAGMPVDGERDPSEREGR